MIETVNSPHPVQEFVNDAQPGFRGERRVRAYAGLEIILDALCRTLPVSGEAADGGG